jgi:hypothetical protein
MLKPKRKRPNDVNKLAYSVFQDAIRLTEQPQKPGKNPAAVALGRLGASKGGKARAESLSARRRKQIAKAAAAVRWARNLPEPD